MSVPIGRLRPAALRTAQVTSASLAMPGAEKEHPTLLIPAASAAVPPMSDLRESIVLLLSVQWRTIVWLLLVALQLTYAECHNFNSIYQFGMSSIRNG